MNIRKGLFIFIAIGLILAGAGVYFRTVKPLNCPAPMADARTTLQLFDAIGGVPVEQATDMDLAIWEILSIQEGKKILPNYPASKFFAASGRIENEILIQVHPELGPRKKGEKEPAPQTAAALLESLRKADPENGAYSFLMASLSGRAKEAQGVLEEFDRAFSAKRFDTHVVAIERRIREKGIGSLEGYRVSNTLISQIVRPNLLRSYSRLLEVLPTAPPELARKVLARAKAELDGFIAEEEKRVWSPGAAAEYDLFQGMFDAAWPLLHLGEPVPDAYTFSSANRQQRIAARRNGGIWARFSGCAGIEAREYAFAKREFESKGR